jgi:hypothetical protein
MLAAGVADCRGCAQTIVALDADEAQKLAAFMTGKPYIQRHPVATPAKARFGQVDD